MTLPPSSHYLWREIVTGAKKHDFKFFAAKMVVGRASIILRNDSSETKIKGFIDELRDVFEKNIKLPKVQQDLITIFGQGGL